MIWFDRNEVFDMTLNCLAWELYSLKKRKLKPKENIMNKKWKEWVGCQDPSILRFLKALAIAVVVALVVACLPPHQRIAIGDFLDSRPAVTVAYTIAILASLALICGVSKKPTKPETKGKGTL
jgi:hypothetical protein